MKCTGPLHRATDFLFPAKPTKLETVGHFAIEGVMGNLDSETHKIIGPEMLIEYESKWEAKNRIDSWTWFSYDNKIELVYLNILQI